MRLTIEYSAPKLGITVKPQKSVVSTGIPVVKEYLEVEAYTGIYDVTPSAETRILDTAGKRMTQPVTIEPIPSNYGLITWDGSTLTVS